MGNEHRDYLAALDALVDRRDAVIAAANDGIGLDLLEEFREPVPEIDAIDRACVRLKNVGALLDIAVAAPLCSD